MANSKFRWLARHKAYLMLTTKNGTNQNTIGSTLHRVPQFKSYGLWVERYNSTPPIRGRDTLWRPLANRRDVDRLSFGIVDGVVTFKCFGAEIMRWHKDETIEICNHRGHMQGYGVAMLTWLVPNMLGAYTKGGNIIAKYAADKAHVCPKWDRRFDSQVGEMEVVDSAPVMVVPKDVWLTLNKVGEFYVPQKYEHKQWAINRTESKRIRGVYKGFTDYVRMSCNLLKDSSDDEYVEFSIDFIKPYVTDPTSELEMDAFNKKNPRFMEYLRHWQVLATSGDAEKMSAALGMLLASTITLWMWRTYKDTKSGWRFNVPTILKKIDDVVLRAHAEEVLELVDVKEGSTPSTKYDTWGVGPAHSYGS